MQVNGPEGQKSARDKSLAVSVACIAIYLPTPGSIGKTFKLCVLNRWDFNFCVRSSPLRGNELNSARSGSIKLLTQDKSPWSSPHVMRTLRSTSSDINQSSQPTPFYALLVISVLTALSTTFRSINSPNNSTFSHSILPVLFLPYWSFQPYLSHECLPIR